MSICSRSGRVLRAQKINLAARKSWCASNDPEFAASCHWRASSMTAAEVVGLYLAPPEYTIVICVATEARFQHDEKPFVWTKSEVHQKRLKPCFAVQ